MSSENTNIETPRSPSFSLIHRSTSVLLLLFVVATLSGLPRLTFDDDLKNLFKGESQEYKEYQKFSQTFGSTDKQCVILLKSHDVLSNESMMAIRRVDTALDALPEVENVRSMCGLLEPKRVGRMFFTAIPYDESKIENWDSARKVLLHHSLGPELQFSSDRKYTLISIQLSSSVLPENVAGLKNKIDELLKREWTKTGHRESEFGFTGLPIIRSEITDSLQRDQRKFTLLGLVFAVVIGWGLFRKPIPVLLLAAIPFTGLGCIMGILGWLNMPLNIVNNVVTPLVLVIGFAEVIHILFLTGGFIGLGYSPPKAVQTMVRQLIVPCLLAALTTAIGFGSLFLAEDKSLKDFAIVASVSSLIMFAIVLASSSCLLATPLAKYCVRNAIPPKSDSGSRKNEGGAKIKILSSFVSVFSIGVVLVFGLVAMRNHFDYRYTENLPESNTAVETLHLIDHAFGGSSPNYVVLEFDSQPKLEQLFELLRRLQDRLEASESIEKTISFINLLDSMPPKTGTDRERFGELRYLPKQAWESLIKVKPAIAKVQVNLPDIGSHNLLPIMDQIKSELNRIENEDSSVNATLTGLNVLTVTRSQKMISDLVSSLLGASLVIFGLILIVYRSLVFAIAAIVVNAFPILGVAAIMSFVGQPIQYTGIMLLCTCLGLAVDDTVHFLSKTQIQLKEGAGFGAAVVQSAKKLWPVLFTTSLMLGVGFGLAATSDIPTFQTFGGYACIALALALIGDLLILPFLLITFHRLFGRKSG